MTEADLSATLNDAAASCAYFHTRRATRSLAAHYDRALVQHGLRGTQFTLLTAIALHGTATTSQLADTLGTDRTTLTRNLAVLKRDDFINIVDGDDRRERLHSLSEAGRAKLTAAAPAWQEAQTELAAAIGQANLDSLLRATSAIAAITAN